MNPKIQHILVPGDCPDEVIAQIKHLAPQAVVYKTDDLKRDPSLVEKLEITYGQLSPEQYSRAKNLKWTHSLGAGCEWTQEPSVQNHPVIVTNSRIHAVQISEHLFGMLLMLVRRLHDSVKSQLKHSWDHHDSQVLHSLPDKTLCILGLGTIGRRCAMLGKAHGMRIIALRRHAQAAADVETIYLPDRLDEALSQADVIMNILPGVKGNAKIIGKRQFDLMRPSCLFLNAGRGSTVDTAAMVSALQSGRLGGAGLDVVDPEPLPADSPLWDLPNVIISAHNGGSTEDYFQQTAELFLRNLRHYLCGEELESVVDKVAGY